MKQFWVDLSVRLLAENEDDAWEKVEELLGVVAYEIVVDKIVERIEE